MKDLKWETLKWETIDAVGGHVQAATIGKFRVYVCPDGTWMIFVRHPRRPWRRSDHRTRGTDAELGKRAAIEYMNKYAR